MFSTFYSTFSCKALYLNSARLIAGLSLTLASSSIAPSAWAGEFSPNEMRLAQTQFTTDSIPPSSQLANSTHLQYGDRVNGALNVSSIRHQGRRFAIYNFSGEAGQLIRISLVGGMASDRVPGQLQLNSLLINPVLILLDPTGKIIAQEPEQTDVANALIRMNLPATGTYTILVTSDTIGGGGRFTLTLQQLSQEQ